MTPKMITIRMPNPIKGDECTITLPFRCVLRALAYELELSGKKSLTIQQRIGQEVGLRVTFEAIPMTSSGSGETTSEWRP